MVKRISRTFKVFELSGERLLTLRGKNAAILTELIERGTAGLTALELKPWTTRLSNYVGAYRSDHGLKIETISEKNTGEFGGNHGRYVLHTAISILPEHGEQKVA